MIPNQFEPALPHAKASPAAAALRLLWRRGHGTPFAAPPRPLATMAASRPRPGRPPHGQPGQARAGGHSHPVRFAWALLDKTLRHLAKTHRTQRHPGKRIAFIRDRYKYRTLASGTIPDTAARAPFRDDAVESTATLNRTAVRGGRRAGLGLALAALLAASLAGCGAPLTFDASPKIDSAENTLPAPAPAGAAPVLAGEPYALAVAHFNRGDYGLSQRYFLAATQKAPKDSSAWIGLAASYDRISRFDLADRAYKNAIGLSGETAQILNNQGYSYLLRGNVAAARAKFMKARERDPSNPTLVNNIKLLEGSARYLKRDPL